MLAGDDEAEFWWRAGLADEKLQGVGARWWALKRWGTTGHRGTLHEFQGLWSGSCVVSGGVLCKSPKNQESENPWQDKNWPRH
jgi:hypothetical protein